MKMFYASKEIINQTRCVESPKQNGIVECRHQQVLNVTRTLLFRTNLSVIFRCFAIQHVVFLINYIHTSACFWVFMLFFYTYCSLKKIR